MSDEAMTEKEAKRFVLTVLGAFVLGIVIMVVVALNVSSADLNPKYERCQNAEGVVMAKIEAVGEKKQLVCVKESALIGGVLD